MRSTGISLVSTMLPRARKVSLPVVFGAQGVVQARSAFSIFTLSEEKERYVASFARLIKGANTSSRDKLPRAEASEDEEYPDSHDYRKNSARR